MTIAYPLSTLKPSINAAILMAALELLQRLGRTETPRSPGDIIALVGCSRSQAYAMYNRFVEMCASIHESPGRPASASADSASLAVLMAIRDHLLRSDLPTNRVDAVDEVHPYGFPNSP